MLSKGKNKTKQHHALVREGVSSAFMYFCTPVFKIALKGQLENKQSKSVLPLKLSPALAKS